MNFADFISRLRANYWRILVGIVVGIIVALGLYALTPRSYVVARDVTIDLIDPNTSQWQTEKTVTPGMTAALRAIADNSAVVDAARADAEAKAGHPLDVTIELKQYLGTATIRVEGTALSESDAEIAVEAMVEHLLPIRHVMMNLTPYELTVERSHDEQPAVKTNPNLVHTLFGGAIVFGVAGVIWALVPRRSAKAAPVTGEQQPTA